MTINFDGEIMDFKNPKIVGILNLTSDSFFDGGRYLAEKETLKQVEKMLLEGADIIDIGGQSTRPGSTFLNSEQELQTIIPAIKSIKKRFPQAKISVDTFWAKVAEESVNEGVGMINDISGGEIDPKMFQTIGCLKIPYVLMHMRGTPQTMGEYTQYNNIIEDINYYFSEKINQLRAYGINDILLDPGFGFSKTLEQNYELMNGLESFHFFKLPLYVGVSRKGMIYKPLNISAQEALIGTSALHLYALQKGTHLLRVHDIKEAKQMIKLNEMLKQTKQN